MLLNLISDVYIKSCVGYETIRCRKFMVLIMVEGCRWVTLWCDLSGSFDLSSARMFSTVILAST